MIEYFKEKSTNLIKSSVFSTWKSLETFVLSLIFNNKKKSSFKNAGESSLSSLWFFFDIKKIDKQNQTIDILISASY